MLQAVPDQRRGERVNIGIAILKEDGLDIRVFETRKIQALTGESWDTYIDSYSTVLKRLDDPTLKKPERLDKLSVAQGQIVLTKNGWFKSSGIDAYEATIADIVKTVVLKPARKRVREDTSIVSEISAELRSAQILAGKDETLDSGKVLREFAIEAGSPQILRS